MKISKIIALSSVIWMSVLSFSFAQSAEDLAAEYVAMPQVQDMMDHMFSPSAMGAQVTNMFPPALQQLLTEEKTMQIGELLSQEMQGLRGVIEDSMRENLPKNFTVEEIEALMAFYSSPVGASVMKKLPQFQQDSMGPINGEIQASMQKIAPKIQEILLAR